MALNLNSIAKKIGPFTRKYNDKDVILYALGVGAGFAELEYCYEKDLKVIPSFSIGAILNIDFLLAIAEVTDVILQEFFMESKNLFFIKKFPLKVF